MPSESELNLNSLFYPKTIAIVGLSSKRGLRWSSGNAYINGCIKQGFSGKIYPVHPKAKSILGFKCYPNIREIPDRIDFVIFCVPSSAVIDVMKDCVEKGVKFVHLLTAGFSETGRDDLAETEKKLIEMAGEAGIRIVGPNCMGLYCPEGGLAWNNDLPEKIGTVSIFSQSGQLANNIVHAGTSQGTSFSKVVSFGNACDLKAHDFLNYMADDPKTEIICAYVEGLKCGKEFFKAAKRITMEKPLVVLKGGQTDGGARATQSHTAALAGSYQIWKAMCRQAGIIAVNSLDEVTYTVSALRRLSLPKGTNVAILGGAGGGGVIMTDLAEKERLQVPHLSDASIQKLEASIPLEGSSAKNPLDILGYLKNKDNFLNVMTTLKDDANIDALIFSLNVAMIYRNFGRVGMNRYIRLLVSSQELLEKPMYLVLESVNDPEVSILRPEVEELLIRRKTPVFPSFEIAARVLRNLKEYKDFLSREA